MVSQLPLTTAQRALLEREYDNMLSCVRCGLCLTSCPTYVLSLHESEGPRGRVAMARALAEGHLAVTPDLVEHEDNCLVCDACTAICPAGVHMDPLQVALRSVLEPARKRPWPERALRWFIFRRLFPNMGLFRLLVRGIWLYQVVGLQWLVRTWGILQVLGLKETEAFLPRVPGRFVVPRGEVYPAVASPESKVPSGTSRDSGPGTGDSSVGRVSFFAGCVMSTALADVDRATIRVLQRAGCEVVNTAGQGCCGALNAHGGDLEAARELMRRNIATYEAGGRDGSGTGGDEDSPIVVNSAGCGAMLKDYAHHLRDDPAWAARAERFTARVKDITEVLAGRELPLQDSSKNGKTLAVTYQDPCHLAHAQRITRQPRALLAALPGVEVREMAESTLCCGSAGIYNVTNPEESRRLQQRKLDNALATGAQVIATANPGCLLQLQSGLRERGSDVRVKHVVELLDEASR